MDIRITDISLATSALHWSNGIEYVCIKGMNVEFIQGNLKGEMFIEGTRFIDLDGIKECIVDRMVDAIK